MARLRVVLLLAHLCTACVIAREESKGTLQDCADFDLLHVLLDICDCVRGLYDEG